jgi:hypothetical protein
LACFRAIHLFNDRAYAVRLPSLPVSISTRVVVRPVANAHQGGIGMRDHRNAMSFRRIPVVLVAALLVGANPALAADRTISVSGDSVPSDCGAAKSPSSAVELSGSLVGCLAIFVQHFNCHAMNGFDFSTELGREEFEGLQHALHL